MAPTDNKYVNNALISRTNNDRPDANMRNTMKMGRENSSSASDEASEISNRHALPNNNLKSDPANTSMKNEQRNVNVKGE